MHLNRRIRQRLAAHLTEAPEVCRPIAPRHSLRAETHERMPADTSVYKQDWADDTLTFNCGYCGIPWPVREQRTVPVGHLIELCAACRLGRTRCDCPNTVFGTKGASDTTIWIPMLHKTTVCGLCAGVYDEMIIHPMHHTNRRGEPVAPYLPSSGTMVEQTRKPKPEVSRDVREFYGDTFSKGLQKSSQG